ncbi:hypothetical protein QEH44_gp39 [Arthrobacter phage Shambre1]|uniref:Uncharacterized protein n=1 Tax=Arthrobacter phage Shambre1 TaxID=2927284 RepID=A0A977KNL0_9CAUD|nr:hypothetical protein QEH44_gp39 [Arthrobacter phage Shambre1]UXE04775.1 hypothetical protein SEA_SHAMBRE1_39 [Arthrobacter phage Shambre1]
MAEAAPERANLAAVPDTEDGRQQRMVALAAQILHHKDQAAKHAAAAKAAEVALAQLHGKQGSTIPVGDYQVTWKNPNSAFDKEAFVKAYPIEANAYLYKTPEPVLDTDAIPPKLKKQFMKPGEGTGSIVIK